LADKGILFLDEISEMPIHLQSKLLRVLERREIMRIGGNKYIPVDVMILAATNRNLEEEIRKGEFREDIFYRLNMVKIEVPPLRERKEDIVFLAKHFLNVVTHRLKKEIVLPENTLKLLENYAFPGNVRELKNIIFSAALFCKDKVILPEVIQSYFKKSASFNNSQNSSNSKGEVDKDTLIASLRHNEGNISETAKELGYSREGLSRKIKRLEIDLESLKVEENS
jgi:transcriptional regulator with GAF, ATPase, and Fis domain